MIQKPYKVLFVTKSGHALTEQHTSLEDARLRAYALSWVIESVAVLEDGTYKNLRGWI